MIEDCKRELTKLQWFQRRLFYLRFVAINERTGKGWTNAEITVEIAETPAEIISVRTLRNRLTDIYDVLDGVDGADDVDDEWIRAFDELAGNPIPPDIFPDLRWSYIPIEEPEEEKIEEEKEVEVEKEVTELPLTVSPTVDEIIDGIEDLFDERGIWSETELTGDVLNDIPDGPEEEPPVEVTPPVIITTEEPIEEPEEPPIVETPTIVITEDELQDEEEDEEPISYRDFIRDAEPTLAPPLPDFDLPREPVFEPDPPSTETPIDNGIFQIQPPWWRDAGARATLVVAALAALCFFVVITIIAGRELLFTDNGDETPREEVSAAREPDTETEPTLPITGPTPTPFTLPSSQKGVDISLYHDPTAGEKGQILLIVTAAEKPLEVNYRLHEAAKDFQDEWQIGDNVNWIYGRTTSEDYDEWQVPSRENEPGDYAIVARNQNGVNDIIVPKHPWSTTLVQISLGVLEVGVLTNGQANTNARINVYNQTSDISGNNVAVTSDSIYESKIIAWAETDLTGIATLHLAEGTYAIEIRALDLDIPYLYEQWFYDIGVTSRESDKLVLEMAN